MGVALRPTAGLLKLADSWAGAWVLLTHGLTGEGVEGNGVLYDLKMMLLQCKQSVPPELDRHPAAQDAEKREKGKKPKVQHLRME